MKTRAPLHDVIFAIVVIGGLLTSTLLTLVLLPLLYERYGEPRAKGATA
jgi:cobalt-zinc-cadmium resistance protein CzcA